MRGNPTTITVSHDYGERPPPTLKKCTNSLSNAVRNVGTSLSGPCAAEGGKRLVRASAGAAERPRRRTGGDVAPREAVTACPVETEATLAMLIFNGRVRGEPTCLF